MLSLLFFLKGMLQEDIGNMGGIFFLSGSFPPPHKLLVSFVIILFSSVGR